LTLCNTSFSHYRSNWSSLSYFDNISNLPLYFWFTFRSSHCCLYRTLC